MIFVHLFNDRSGSPRVLASVIEVLADAERDLLCVAHGDGILESSRIPRRHYRYRRRSNRSLTFVEYLISQLALFILLIKVTRNRPNNEPIYVNTAYPFAAALFGKWFGREVIYHLHEISITPTLLRRFLWSVVKSTASEVRLVSDHQRKCTDIDHENIKVIHNAIARELSDKASETIQRKRARVMSAHGDEPFRVLMLSTMRDYKGVPEFFALARQFESDDQYVFELIANDDRESVARYLDPMAPVPSNIAILERSDDLAPIYERASVVLNLSRYNEWVETFGLTILEAMSFSVPVIAPPVGGPVELLGPDLKEFLVHGYDLEGLTGLLKELKEDQQRYSYISQLCRSRAQEFDWSRFGSAIQI